MVEDGQVQELQSILGCTYEQACSALHDAQGNMEWAMNRILDGPASPAPPPSLPIPERSLTAPPSYTEYPSTQSQDEQDADLQRAVAASMVQHPTAPSASNEDEELMRALAESVQGAPHARPDLMRRRQELEPVVFVPSIPTYKAVAWALQALYAATPLCQALYRYPKPDTRITNLAQYWNGVSPSGPCTAESQHTQLIQRIQTLFFFATHTVRAVVVTGDIDAILPRDIMLQASWQQNMHALIKAFVDLFAHAWKTNTCLEQHHLFQMFVVPTSASAPTDELSMSTLVLDHTATESSVYSCLSYQLTDHEQAYFINRAPLVLCLPVQHSTTGPFRIDLTVYLDSFLWNKRTEDDVASQCASLASQYKASEAEKRHWTARLASFTEHDALSSTQQSEAYLEHVAHSPLSDWMTRIRKALEQRVSKARSHISALDEQLTSLRTTMTQLQEKRWNDPAWQTMPYDLCAAVFQTNESEWAYIQHNGQWWRLEDTHAQAIDPHTMTTDPGVVFLAYTQRAYKAQEPTLETLTALRDAVAKDNEEAERTLS